MLVPHIEGARHKCTKDKVMLIIGASLSVLYNLATYSTMSRSFWGWWVRWEGACDNWLRSVLVFPGVKNTLGVIEGGLAMPY